MNATKKQHSVDSAAAIFGMDMITRDDWNQVIEEDIILHNEYFYRQPPSGVEQDLFRAILQQALYDFLTFLPKRDILIRQFDEIYNYFFNENNNIEIGSFNFICDILDLDKSYIRKCLTYEKEGRSHK